MGKERASSPMEIDKWTLPIFSLSSRQISTKNFLLLPPDVNEFVTVATGQGWNWDLFSHSMNLGTHTN